MRKVAICDKDEHFRKILGKYLKKMGNNCGRGMTTGEFYQTDFFGHLFVDENRNTNFHKKTSSIFQIFSEILQENLEFSRNIF